MLSKERATFWYDSILINDNSGNCEQKVLGLRRIFDSVLLEMFPNIPEQDFYRACVDEIFNLKKSSGEFRPPHQKHCQEFHRLRKYLNAVQHSKIVADKEGYIIAVRRLALLIKYCSKQTAPKELVEIYKQSKPVSVSQHLQNTAVSPRGDASSAVSIMSNTPTICIIVDRHTELSNSILHQIDSGVSKLVEHAKKSRLNFIVFTLKTEMAILAFPIIKKKSRFKFNFISDEEQIKPLRDYLINFKPALLCQFYISHIDSVTQYHSPIQLDESSFLMKIGIVDDIQRFETTKGDVPKFDKLIKDSNISSLFEWIEKITIKE